MNRVKWMRIIALVTLALTVSCYASGPARTVQRVNPDAQIDLSGKWNDTDANQVARAMIQDCLSRPWATSFKAQHNRLPVVRLWPIKNRSSDHVQTMFFTKQVEMELLNSGMVKVVSSLNEAADNRDERADQAHNASDSTVKAQQQETASDFVLNGWILSENDAVDGQTVKAFVTTMELSNSESNEKVWMKVHKIKKVINQAASEW